MCLPASKHIFPFSFYYPMNTLPGSFCTQYGSIQHQVVAYLKTPHGFHKLALQPIYFGDYLNLTFDPVALSPLRLERSKKSFVYSLVHPTSPMKRPLQFTLKVPQRGFLPGEYSPFTLSVINLTGKSLTRILFSFIQKITYHADKSKKTMASVLDLTETVEADSATETLWESGFFVPEGIKPSYKGTIEYQYYIKVCPEQCIERKVKSNGSPIKLISSRKSLKYFIHVNLIPLSLLCLLLRFKSLLRAVPQLQS